MAKQQDGESASDNRVRQVKLSADFLGRSFAKNPKFLEWIGLQAALLSMHRDNDADDDDRMASFITLIHGVAPQDEIEAMLAVQMAAVHNLTVTMAIRLGKATMLPQVDSAERALNKLARTFATEMEALKRYRSKGEQRVVVEHQHVHVYPGGQAVVGTVNQGVDTGGVGEIEGQSHGRYDRLRIPEGTAVLGSIEADEMPLPGSGPEGQESVPVPRGKSRRALRAV